MVTQVGQKAADGSNNVTIVGGSSAGPIDTLPAAGNTTAAVVAIVDGSGNQITSFGGGTQYTEGDTDASITGTALLWEDAADTLRAVSAAKPLPIGDAGGSLTVDGTFWQATQPVSIASAVAVTQSGTWDEVGINDSGNSITVDAPAGTPVFVRISDGAAAVDTLPVSLATLPTLANVTTLGTITNVVHVDDNSSSLTIDGTVTANLAAGTNNIGDVDVLSIATGDNNIGNVDVVTLPALVAGSALIGKIDHPTTGIGHGVTTVTTAGTDVVLASSTAAKWVSIQAQTDNTGKIAVGATGVDATIATGNGILLNAGDVINLPVDNLADVYIDSTVNGDGVRYTYGT